MNSTSAAEIGWIAAPSATIVRRAEDAAESVLRAESVA
jgi:hypothetical protein